MALKIWPGQYDNQLLVLSAILVATKKRFATSLTPGYWSSGESFMYCALHLLWYVAIHLTFYTHPYFLYYNLSVVKPGVSVWIFHEFLAYYFGGEKSRASGLQA